MLKQIKDAKAHNTGGLNRRKLLNASQCKGLSSFFVQIRFIALDSVVRIVQLHSFLLLIRG